MKKRIDKGYNSRGEGGKVEQAWGRNKGWNSNIVKLGLGKEKKMVFFISWSQQSMSNINNNIQKDVDYGEKY